MTTPTSQRRRLLSQAVRTLFAAATLAAALPAVAQDGWPNKPIRIIVPFSPGGGGDAVVRFISDRLGERLKQQVIIENRPGASGFIGAQAVATAPPDGYTLLMGFDGGVVVAPHILKAPFNPLTDFEPITKLNDATLIIVAHPAAQIRNVADLVAQAKARPGQLQFTSSGQGSTPHLAGELLAIRTGIKMTHVPYKGGGQAVTDVVAGQVPVFITVVPTIAAYVKQDRLIPVAVTSAKRSPSLPDVPTVEELGVPGFSVSSWYGLLAPAKTPKAIVNRLQQEIAAVLAMPDIRDRYLAAAFDPVGNTPEEFAAQIRADYARWGQVVKDANLRERD
ncbi:MAG: Bug family tripartite tricarboxylate transporter substrate binding protein [Burkholderiales bacterium]|jgi:tripartite-type tricarboxylate transporter receptor subunit TctC